MLVDGERIKALVASAKREVLLCAPFIKVGALKVILSVLPKGVSLRVITRWRVEEVACGVSDLEVFDVVGALENANLKLLNELHAKLYLADENCLIGSANLTGAALGWSTKPNVELLLGAQRANPEIAALIERLKDAVQATPQMRADIEEQAARLGVAVNLADGDDISKEIAEIAQRPWLPQCATPDKLFAVYRNPRTPVVVPGTREDAVDDLLSLALRRGLSEAEFSGAVATTLEKFPSIRRILDKVPARLADQDALAIIRELRPDLSEPDVRKQWSIVRDWIGVFFANRFEVAPESFVLRIKS